MGKQHRTKHPKGKAQRATEPFELINSDVCGPMSVNSIGGSPYFVTFTDDYTRYTYIYFVEQKDEVLAKFQEFVNMVNNRTGKNVETFRTDDGGEYCSKEFESFLKDEGIVHQLTVPYNPVQNGVSERKNRTLVESARSMMSYGQIPVELWAEAMNTEVYLRNRSPTTSLEGMTPYECLFGQKPDVSNLRVFGCIAFIHIPENKGRYLMKNLERLFSLVILKEQKAISFMIPQIEGSSVAEMWYLWKENSMISKVVNQVLLISTSRWTMMVLELKITYLLLTMFQIKMKWLMKKTCRKLFMFNQWEKHMRMVL